MLSNWATTQRPGPCFVPQHWRCYPALVASLLTYQLTYVDTILTAFIDYIVPPLECATTPASKTFNLDMASLLLPEKLSLYFVDDLVTPLLSRSQDLLLPFALSDSLPAFRKIDALGFFAACPCYAFCQLEK